MCEIPDAMNFYSLIRERRNGEEEEKRQEEWH
jgi:hypothetical protein